jgi:hypothetical protein
MLPAPKPWGRRDKEKERYGDGKREKNVFYSRDNTEKREKEKL